MSAPTETTQVVYRSASTVVSRAVRDGMKVVVKSLAGEAPDAEARSRLIHEAAVLDLLHGLAVPVALGLDESGTAPSLLLLDEGHHDLLRGAPWSVDDFFELALPVTRIVADLHARGVVHRDINPSNLLQRPGDGDAKLIDFGLAVLGPQTDRVESIVGTLPYLAPEQSGRVERPVDARADLYALGATFYELLVGRPPFDAEDAVGLVHAHLSKPAPGIRESRADVPDAVNMIVARLLEKEPEERYPSAASLVADLERCLDHWQRNASIPLFELAATGRPKISVPSDPIGVDDAVGELLVGGDSRLVAITGGEGSGKSMLLALARGGFGDAAVVFDGSADGASGQARTSQQEPFARIAQAVDYFARELLASSDDDELGIWRDRLVFAAGPMLGTLVELAPTIASIVGPVPDGAETGHGVHDRVEAMEALLADLGWDSHPVLVFDDVDSADPETIAVLEELVASPKIAGLSVLCTAQQLPDRLADLIDDDEIQTCAVALAPLDLRSLTELVEHALGTTVRPASDLAAAVMPVTSGSPGLVLELLRQQAESGGLTVDEEGRWDWSDEALASLPRSAALVDMLVAEFGDLDDESRLVLGVAACFARPVRPQDLGVADVGADLAARVLGAGARLGLLRSNADGFAFVDDRLLGSVEDHLDPDIRSSVHLALARQQYREAVARDDLKAQAPTIARRLEAINRTELSTEDRALAVDVHRSSAESAEASGVYDVAHRHLSLAVDICAGDEERFDLAVERAVCSLQAGLPVAERDAQLLLPMATTALQKAQALQRQAVVAHGLGRPAEALDAIRQGLAELDITMPNSETEVVANTAERLTHLKRTLASGSAENLAVLPELQDPVIEQSIALLGYAVPAAFRTQQSLVPWIELTMFDLVVEHGVTAEAPKCLLGTGVVAMDMLEDPQAALLLADTGMVLAKRFPGHPNEATVSFLAGLFIEHLRHPIETSIATLGRAWKEGATGDPQQAAIAAAYRCLVGETAGLPLDEQLVRVAETTNFIRSVRSRSAEELLFPHQKTVEALLGQTDPEEAVGELLAYVEDLEEPSDAASAHVCQAVATIEWWTGCPVRAWDQLEAGGESLVAFKGRAIESNHLLTLVLAGVGTLAALEADRDETGDGSSEPHPGQAAIETKVIAALTRLQVLAETNPEFHGPFARLAEAEWGRHRGQPLARLVSGYDAAVAGCGDRYPQLRALANQRHAELWLEDGHPTVAKALFREAWGLYEAWQCRPKIKQIEAAHPAYFESGEESDQAGDADDSVSPGQAPQLDVESVVKATQAITMEVTAEGLFAALMSVLVEYAGAQSGALVSIEDGTMHIEASISPDAEPEIGRRKVTSRSEVAVRAVNFVRRTGELLVAGNAAADARFRNDQHVRGSRVRSMACVPLVLRGELSAVLYLENNALSGAFTSEHVELIKVIAAQAAVSIQQVRVFEELEQRVDARTKELADKNRQIEALLDNLPQAVLTIGPERLVDPQVSAKACQVLGVDELVGTDVMDAVFSGTSVDADARSRCEAALDFSFGNDEFMAKLNWPHLVSGFTRTDEDGHTRTYSVDWAPITDELNVVHQILVSVRDTTALVEAQAKASAATRDLTILEQMFSVGVQKCIPFLESERRRIDEVATLVDSAADEHSAADKHSTAVASEGWADSLFRSLHTTKGNARMLGLGALVAVVHAAEEPVAELARGEQVDLAVIAESVQRIVDCLDDHVRLLERGFGRPLHEAGDGSSDLLISRLKEVLAADEASSRRALDRVEALLEGDLAPDVATVVREATQSLPSLAEELGKPTPSIVAEGPSPEISRDLVGPLRDALVHLVRNSIDHGIESAEERAAANKPEAGTITVEVSPGEESATRLTQPGFSVRVFDDGRGLALARLREITVAGADDQAVAETIFRAGLTTSDEVTATSGRGVGMDAVRSFLHEQGCEVNVEFRGEEVNGYRPFAIVIEVPPRSG